MVKYIDNNGCTCCLNTTTVKPSSPAIAFYDGNGTKQYIATTSATLSGHPAFYDSDGCKYYVGVAPAVGNLRMYADHIEVCAAHPFTITLCSCAYSSTCGAAADSLCITIPANFTGCCTWDNFLNDAVFSKAVEDAANGCTGAYSGYYFTTTNGNLCFDDSCKWCAHCNSIWCCTEVDYESYNIGYTGLNCIRVWNETEPIQAAASISFCCCIDEDSGCICDSCIAIKRWYPADRAIPTAARAEWTVTGFPSYHGATVCLCGWNAYGSGVGSTVTNCYVGCSPTFTRTGNANNIYTSTVGIEVPDANLMYSCPVNGDLRTNGQHFCCSMPSTKCVAAVFKVSYDGGAQCICYFAAKYILDSTGTFYACGVNSDTCSPARLSSTNGMGQFVYRINQNISFPAYREISGVSCAHSL